MADVERALAFVAQHGGPVEQARLQHLLDGTPAPAAAAARLLAGCQRSDGAWEEAAARTAAAAPPWVAPDDNGVRLYLTANAGSWLAAWDAGPGRRGSWSGWRAAWTRPCPPATWPGS